MNLYSYVKNNPVNWVDFLGLDVNSDALNAGAGDAFGADSFGGGSSTNSGGGGGNYDLGVDRGPNGFGPTASATDGYSFEEILSDLASQMLLAAALSWETGPPSLVCMGIGTAAIGIKAGFYSAHPYRDTVQNAVLSVFGTGKPFGDFILGEVVDQFNEYYDQTDPCESK